MANEFLVSVVLMHKELYVIKYKVLPPRPLYNYRSNIMQAADLIITSSYTVTHCNYIVSKNIERCVIDANCMRISQVSVIILYCNSINH